MKSKGTVGAEYVVGYKGKTKTGEGMIYAPYIPLIVTPAGCMGRTRSPTGKSLPRATPMRRNQIRVKPR